MHISMVFECFSNWRRDFRVFSMFMLLFNIALCALYVRIHENSSALIASHFVLLLFSLLLPFRWFLMPFSCARYISDILTTTSTRHASFGVWLFLGENLRTLWMASQLWCGRWANGRKIIIHSLLCWWKFSFHCSITIFVSCAPTQNIKILSRKIHIYTHTVNVIQRVNVLSKKEKEKEKCTCFRLLWIYSIFILIWPTFFLQIFMCLSGTVKTWTIPFFVALSLFTKQCMFCSKALVNK